MGEFSRNISQEPMRVQRRVAATQAVIRGMVQSTVLEPETLSPAPEEGEQLILDIAPSGAGYVDGTYTTGRL